MLGSDIELRSQKLWSEIRAVWPHERVQFGMERKAPELLRIPQWFKQRTIQIP